VYCGPQSHDGERFPLTDWPRFVEPEDFFRRREERGARAGAARRGKGRPPEGYVIAVEGPKSLIGNNPRLPMERIAADKATAGAGVNSANG
jgi:hypothetical protein